MSYAGPVKADPTARSIPRRSPVMSTDFDRTTTLLVGAAVGVALGAGLALLFAPASGRATRRKIARGTRRFGTAARDRGRDAWSDLKHELGRMRRRRREQMADDQRRSFSRRAATSL